MLLYLLLEWIDLFYVKTMMMACEWDWGKSCDLKPLLPLWLLVFTDEFILKYTLWYVWLGLVWFWIEISWLFDCEVVLKI